MSHWENAEQDPRPSRHFERGDLKFVILDLLGAHPSHGYEIIRALEERFHGFYTPSPGAVYPTLQWLQDLEYVTVLEQEGRKVYTITDEGRRFMAERGPKMEEIRERMRNWWAPAERPEMHDELHQFAHQLRNWARQLRHEARWAGPDQLRRVREVVVRAANEIQSILGETDATQTGGANDDAVPPKA